MSSRSNILNLQQLLKWQINKTVNPKTGRTITINGPTYLKLQKQLDKMLKDSSYTPEECHKWETASRLINPKTQKSITKNGLVYERIRNVCEPLEIINTHDTDRHYDDFMDRVKEEELQLYSKQSLHNKIISSVISGCKNCIYKTINTAFTYIGCGHNIKCMVKGCPWNGRIGINIKFIPKAMRDFFLEIVIKFIHPDRCCCVCIGHLLMITFYIGSKIISSNMMSTDTKNTIILQHSVDIIESAIDDSKALDKLMAIQANKELTKLLYKPVELYHGLVEVLMDDPITNTRLLEAGLHELENVN